MIGLLLALQTLAAGAPQPAAGSASPRVDSLQILREAKRAQERFERFHRNELPARHDVWGRRCEERVGRFTFFQGVEGDTVVPAEPEKIARAREALLGQLGRAQASLPADEWIAGQRVRYLVDARRPMEAVEAARDCRSGETWCAALLGLALHAAGEFAAAERAFDDALARMPESERCRWTDITYLLRGELAGRYAKMKCAERAAFEARFWWLARPLFTLEANDLRTEHLARMTMMRAHQAARLVHTIPWGSDLAQHMVRFGWPTAWAQAPAASFTDGPLITEFTPTPSFEFLPAASAVDDPGRAPADAWAPNAACPRGTYAPSYARSFVVPDHQAALFRRGDSAFVVAGYDLRADSTLAPLSFEAALVLSSDERAAPLVETKERAFARDVITAKGPWRAQLLSLEIVSREERRVARGRFGVAPRGGLESGVAVSDLLLFDPRDTLPARLAEVLPFVRGSTRVREGENLGIFWEVYGLDERAERLSVSLTVTPVPGGLLRRAGETLGLVDTRTPIAYHWLEEVAGRNSVTPRAIALDLTRLARGRHVIELVVEPPGRAPLIVRREIEVGKP